MMKDDTIKSTSINDLAILGTYEGECADSNITNKNGLDITRPVWEGVFASEEYDEAIKNGWYIGFLGHPEDPDCMDFEHACIVMTEGHIDNDGKIMGKFNLVNTPVGRIVKAFQDAGVTFGISVRGAGDIIDNSVEPDTFVFRGFDLVSFPAYPESIPKFTEVSASTNKAVQKQYKILCSTVKENLEGLNTSESIDIVQSQFAKQSEEYNMLEKRKNEINQSKIVDSEDIDLELMNELNSKKIESLTNLYQDAIQANIDLKKANEELVKDLAQIKSTYSRKLKVIRRITANQEVQHKHNIANNKRDKLKISAKCDRLNKENEELKIKVQKLSDVNLKYKHKILSTVKDIDDKDSIISRLEFKLNETVNEVKASKSRASNLDEKYAKMESKLSTMCKLLEEYQDAYANFYANAVGKDIKNVRITASTSVKELRSLISESIDSEYNEDEDYVDIEFIDINNDLSDDGGLVTL